MKAQPPPLKLWNGPHMNTPSTPQASPGQPSAAPASRPAFPFVIVFVVWLLVVISATLVTFILPEWYVSTARIQVQRDQSDIPGMQEPSFAPTYDPYFIQTEFEVIRSQQILGKAIDDLGLRQAWGKQYGIGDLKMDEAISILKGVLSLQPERNTSIIDIGVFSQDKNEAARIANKIAEVYKANRLEKRLRLIYGGIAALEVAYNQNREQIQAMRAEIAKLSRDQGDQNALDEARKHLADLQHFGSVLFMRLASERMDATLPATGVVTILDYAVPGNRPIRPNKPLNIFLSILLGGLGGFFLATLVYMLQRMAYRRMSGVPRTQFPPRFRTVVHVLIALVVGIIVGYCGATPFAYSTIIAIPLVLLVGGIASAYIELANPHPLPAAVVRPVVSPPQTDPTNPVK